MIRRLVVPSRILRFFLALVLAAISICLGSPAAHAADSISVSNVTINAGDPAMSPASSIAMSVPFTAPSGGTCGSGQKVVRPYAGKYIDIQVSGATADDVLAIPTVANMAAVSTASGVASVLGSTVYVGDGTVAHKVGTIDSTYNGGGRLRINFTDNDATFLASRTSYSPGNVTSSFWNQWVEEIGRTANTASVWGQTMISGTTLFTKLDGWTGAGGGTGGSFYNNGTSSTLTNPSTSTGTHSGSYPCSLDLFVQMSGTNGSGFLKAMGTASTVTFSANAGDRVYFTHRNWKDSATNVSTIRTVMGLLSGGQLSNLYTADMAVDQAWDDYSFPIGSAGTYQMALVAGPYFAAPTSSFSVNSHVKFDLFTMDAPVTDTWAKNIAKLVTYQNTASTPPTSRTLTYSLGTTSGGTPATATQTLTITPQSTPTPTPTPTSAVIADAPASPSISTPAVVAAPASPTAQAPATPPAPVAAAPSDPTPVSAQSAMPSLLDMASLLASDPGAALSRLAAAVFSPLKLNINVGGAVANPAAGATGNDAAPPVAFDPLGSPESISALSGALVMAVSLAGGVAAAVAGASGGDAGGEVGGAEVPEGEMEAAEEGELDEVEEQDHEEAEEDDAERDELEYEHDEFEVSRRAWGDRLAFLAAGPVLAFDRFSTRSAIRLANKSPLLSKMIIDGAYLRAMVGLFALVLPFLSIALGVVSVSENNAFVATPPWPLFLVMAVIGTLDALAGALGGIAFIIGTIAFSGTAFDMPEFRLLFAVFFVLIGPALLMTAFRAIRKDVQRDFTGFWDRLTDFAIAPLMAGMAASTAVLVMPALAGETLAAANHVADFGILVALAASLRVALEEFASKGWPDRLDTLNPEHLPQPGGFQQTIALATSYALWVILTASLVGNVWEIWVGSFFFLLPTILGKFSSHFPNSVLIWRILPQGLPGLAFKLIVAATSATIVMALVGANPQFAAVNLMLLPLPLLALSVLGMFGRHGATPNEVRFSARFPWLYRLGGVAILLLSLRLMGIV